MANSTSRVDVDNSRLRQSHLGEVAIYLRQLSNAYPEEAISAHLFSAVERQSLPPAVFAVWLSIARSTATLLEALTQSFSVITRRIAIKRVCKLLRRRHWQDTWDGLGGTKGIAALLKRFSVSEVKMVLSLLPRSISGSEVSKKQAKIDELFQGLHPSLYPESGLKVLSEERPLARHYQILLPGCTAEFVDETLRDCKSQRPRTDRFEMGLDHPLLIAHHEVLRQHCLDRTFDSAYTLLNVDLCLVPLLRSQPSLPGSKLGSRAGFSESMDFSLLFLRKLVSRPNIKVIIKYCPVIMGLIEPLLRRAQKKKVASATIKEIFDLSIKYLSSRPAETASIRFLWGRFLHSCVMFWASSSTHRPDFESRLISILKLVPHSHNPNIREFATALQWVPQPLRYKLLKLCFLHAGGKPLDIDDLQSLKERSPKNWPCDLFFSMDREKAIGLLRRLQDAISGDEYLQMSSGATILAHPATQVASGPNPLVLLNLLEDGKAETANRATASVEEWKKKAGTSREQTERAFHAKGALFLAISSGSLELYGDVLMWARRFVRDPLTAKAIFGTNAIKTSEGINLLSGIPHKLDGLGQSDIASRIHLANKIVFDIFETACSALKEPSFHSYDWASAISIISAVIAVRVDCSKRLQQAMNLTDGHLYDLVFESTLDLTMQIARIGQQTDFERLNLRSAGFPMESTHCKVTTPAAFRFVDNLALAKESLWRELRPRNRPCVAVLPHPLPRGLPVQWLANGFEISGESAHDLTPYIQSRAEKVIFANPDEVMRPIPEDDDTRVAVNGFVDSFEYALRLYVSQGKTAKMKKERVDRAWKHALDNLSGRMTPDEAKRTWESYFKPAVPDFEIPNPDPLHVMDYPVFPFDADIAEYSEWNPAEGFNPPPAVAARLFEPMTCLDHSLTTRTSSHFSSGGKLMDTRVGTVGFQPSRGRIWSLDRLSRKQSKNPAIREGLAMSALLYLEQLIPDSKGVLVEPFPSADDARYPPVWLDMSFTEVKGIDEVDDYTAVAMLHKLAPMLPPTLLYKLTQAALTSFINAPESQPIGERVKLERVAYGLLHLLTKSDRPSLAIDFILKVIVDIPTSSSWHRKLLSLGYLRRLSPEHAKNLIQSFADVIEQKPKESGALTKESATASSDTTEAKVAKPYIKITTVKYLAQILLDADYVSEQLAIDTLGNLFQTSKHIDVRVAVVECLISMLAGCPDDPQNPLANQILQVLEATVPIAGRMNEREPITEQDWEEVERTGKLPEVFQEGFGDLDLAIPPILSAMLEKIGNAFKPTWKKRLLEQILLPILKLSIETNTRWVEIFAAKYELDLDELCLPPLPVKPMFLSKLLQVCRDVLPPSIFELYSKFILFNIAPPPEILALNDKLQNVHLVQLQETKHFQSLYAHGPGISHYNKFNLIDLLRAAKESPNSKITVEQIQTHVLEHAKLLVAIDKSNEFRSYMTAFEPSYGYATICDGWLGDAEPVLRHIIAYIDSMRTMAWQRNQNRVPSTLPPTLEYKLILLPYPLHTSKPEAMEVFAKELRGYVREISQPGRLFHDDLPELRGVIPRVPPIHLATIACLLGELPDDEMLEEGLSVEQLLCVELASDFFNSAKVPLEEGVLLMARTVVEGWVRSENEWVRRKGVEILAIIRPPWKGEGDAGVTRQGTWGNESEELGSDLF